MQNRIIRGIPSARLTSLGGVELGSRLAARIAGWLRLPGPATYDAVFTTHDAIVSRMPWPRDASAVYAYEDGALRTFERATRRDMMKVWDLPLPHHASIERMWAEEAARWPDAAGSIPKVQPEWKRSRKARELLLADVVSAPSGYVRRTLEQAGVRKRIVVTPFGFPVQEFPARLERPTGRFTAIAVGTQDLRKGTPYLLEAWKRAAVPGARLVLIGPMRLRPQFLERYSGLFEHVPHIAKGNLGTVYRSADVLILPTLGDGCPLVVQEAMSSGTPVITTECGSGPEFVVTGENGWLLPARDIDALVSALREAAGDRERTFQLGLAARRIAESWTWDEAGAALVAGIEGRDTMPARFADQLTRPVQ